ncbi:hypothetical protein WR25_10616 [Diploscapter pachys]|uniref:Ground-like domain-containing protein n=1 Tax=Diploscapter pachys TaxID=2018661 RepID=A0A2A2JFU9_9BILA|nr:hypothetical protein WR25_10616 [Diploscapter pachys]
MRFITYLFAISVGLATAQFNFLNSGNCGNSNRESTLLSPRGGICCDDLIKNLTKTALSTAGFIPGQSQFVDVAGKAAKAVQTFIQNHFGTAFEVILAKSQFALKTNYVRSEICKFEINGWYLAVYETPADYDINDSVLESYFDGFSREDPLGLKEAPKIPDPRPALDSLPSSSPDPFSLDPASIYSGV